MAKCETLPEVEAGRARRETHGGLEVADVCPYVWDIDDRWLDTLRDLGLAAARAGPDRQAHQIACLPPPLEQTDIAAIAPRGTAPTTSCIVGLIRLARPHPRRAVFARYDRHGARLRLEERSIRSSRRSIGSWLKLNRPPT